MPLLPLLVGSSTALGMGYFCVDVYRNRQRLSKKHVPEVDLTGCDVGIVVPDGDDFQAVGQIVSHGGHAIGEASSECAGGGVGHCVEAIAHVIAHY